MTRRSSLPRAPRAQPCTSPGSGISSISRPLGILLATLASAAIAVQGHFNGEFGQLLGNPVEAAWWGFAEGLVALVLMVAIWQRDQVRRFLAELRAGFPPWQMLGGLAGASLIIGQAGAIPVLGVALFSVLVVSGQTLTSLAVDKWGLAPGGHRPVTLLRGLGALLTIAGVALAVSGQMSVTRLSVGLVLVVIGMGCLLPFQFAFNAQIAHAAGSPLVAAMVNFAVGLLMLSAVLLVGRMPFRAPPSPLEHPQVWAAGFLGVFVVLVAAVVVPTVGVLVFSLLMVSGQLVFGLLVDVFSGQIAVSVSLVAGVLLCVVAVFVGAARR